VKQPRNRQSPKKLELIAQTLPAFAASPKSIPSLSVQKLPITIDIPPNQITDSEDQYEKDPKVIKENLFNCFSFSRQHQGQLTSIYLYLQEHMPDITKWYQLKHLDLSRQHLVRLDDLDTCFPMLETLVM
jgi:protein-tyrosine phosphatase